MVGEILEAEWKEKYPEDIYLHIRRRKEKTTCGLYCQIGIAEEDPSLIGDLLQYGDSIIVVIPIISEAPKGRLILPRILTFTGLSGLWH